VSSATGLPPALVHDGVCPPAMLKLTLPTYAEFVAAHGADSGAFRHLGNMVDAINQAQKALKVARRKMERWHRSARNQLVYRTGDKVWLSGEAFRSMRIAGNVSHKLSPRWYGPFEVEVVRPNAVGLKLPARMKCHPVFNVSYVRPARASSRFSRASARPAVPDLVTGSFAVQTPAAILGRRRRRGGVQYKVTWTGDEAKEFTWEDAYRIRQQAPLLVKAYEEAHPARRRGGAQVEVVHNADVVAPLVQVPVQGDAVGTAEPQAESQTPWDWPDDWAREGIPPDDFDTSLDDVPCLVCHNPKAGRGRWRFIWCDGEGPDHGAHVGCYGLTSVPRGKWYCRECALARELKRSGKQQELQTPPPPLLEQQTAPQARDADRSGGCETQPRAGLRRSPRHVQWAPEVNNMECERAERSGRSEATPGRGGRGGRRLSAAAPPWGQQRAWLPRPRGYVGASAPLLPATVSAVTEPFERASHGSSMERDRNNDYASGNGGPGGIS
jgi:hypothetical protein